MRKLIHSLKISHRLTIVYSTVIILAIVLISGTFYFFGIRIVEEHVENDLRRSSEAITRIISTTLHASIRNYLRGIAERSLLTTEQVYRRVQEGNLTKEEAVRLLRDNYFSKKIGKTGYIYAIDSTGVLVIHPVKRFEGMSLAEYEFAQTLTEKNEGYLEYEWKNPEDEWFRLKAVYKTYFAPWDWLIAVSSYQDEFEDLIDINDFKKTIKSFTFGRSGYAFLLNTQGKVIVHPDYEGEHINALDPDAQNVFRKIIEQKNGPLTYRWKNKLDTKARKKFVYFSYMPEFEWIIVSSIYLDEVYAPLYDLRTILLIMAVFLIFAIIGCSYLTSYHITRPVKDLMECFRKAAHGDFSLRMKVHGNDEISILTAYFNDFMEKLESHSNSLQNEVWERKHIEDTLRYRNRMVGHMNQIANEFLGMPTERLHKAIEQALQQLGLFYEVEHAYICFYHKDDNQFRVAYQWIKDSLKDTFSERRIEHISEYHFWLERFKRGEHIYLPFVDEMSVQNKALKNDLQSRNVKSLINIPMRYKGEIIGFLGFESIGHIRMWNDDDIALLRPLAFTFVSTVMRYRTEKEMQHAKEYAEQLYRIVPNAIYTVDIERRITSWNNRAAEITGYSEEEIIGKTCNVFSLEPCDSSCGLLAEDVEKPVRNKECLITTKAGEKRVINKNVDIIKDENGVIIGGIETFDDITERKKAEEELETYRKHLEKIVKERTDELVRINKRLSKEVDERKQAETLARESEERLEFAMWAADVGLWDWYVPEGRFIINKRWAEIAGYEKSDLDQDIATWEKIVHPEDGAQLTELLYAHVNNESEYFDCEYRCIKKNGAIVWVHDRARTIARTKNGRAIRIVGTHTDITERKLVEQVMHRAKEEAEQASRLKSQFLNNVSHEMRTPLNSIIGFAEFIHTSDSIDEIHNKSEILLYESGTLLSLINDLLDHAKIEAGKLDLDYRPFNLPELIDLSVRGFSDQAKAKGLRITNMQEGECPPYIIGDALRLQQIMSNLLSNAIKFTDEGEVTVLVTCHEEPNEKVHILFKVTDTGIGIPPEQQELVFNSFVQLDGSATRKAGGTGLGITIAKELVEKMGGSLNLESEPGKGTTFSFELTLRIAGQEHIRPSERIGAKDITTIRLGKKILVAEDYEPNQKLAELYLNSIGCEVTIAQNGKEAIEYAEGEDFDAIIMDVQMPIIDGLDATRRIRKLSHKNKNIPIVGLTAHADATVRKACIEAGMNDCFTKPIKRRQFVNALSLLFDEEAQSAKAYVRKRIAEKSGGKEKKEKSSLDIPFNFSQAIEEFDGKKDILLTVIEKFIENVSGQLTTIKEAIEKKDCELIRKEAHKIRGGALNITAERLGIAAERVEQISTNRDMENLPEAVKKLGVEFTLFKDYFNSII